MALLRPPTSPNRSTLKSARQELIDLQRERGKASFREYVKMAWGQVDPAPLKSNWHVDAMTSYLQGVTEGHIQNLIINIPPRSAKSLTVGVFWQTWEWTFFPGQRYIFSSYSGDNAKRDTIASRRLIMTPDINSGGETPSS